MSTVTDMIALYRQTTQDLAQPYLWQDAELIEYLNDAQDQACRRAHLLVDSRSEVTVIDLPANEPVVDVDHRIIHIRRMRRESDQHPMQRIGSRDMDQLLPGWEGNLSASRPTHFIPDWETGVLRVYPPSSVDDRLLMTVVRMPLDPIDSATARLSIPARYHRGLLNWMLYRGYSKADPETLNDAKAKKYEAMFISEFGEESGADDERWTFEQYIDIGEE